MNRDRQTGVFYVHAVLVNMIIGPGNKDVSLRNAWQKR